MLDARLSELRRRVTAGARDLETWLELAGTARRADRLPAFLRPREHAVLLEALLAEAPAQRALAGLWARLVGVEILPGDHLPEGSWWERRARLAGADGHRYDPETGLPLAVRLPGVDLALALVPAGSFTVGTEPTEAAGETASPPRRVTLERPFYLGITPVTRAQFAAALGAAPGAEGPPDLPATAVSWLHAREFCAAAGADLPAGGWGLRLPSEAEWERGARPAEAPPRAPGPRTSPLAGPMGRREPVGPRPVGAGPANGFGLKAVFGAVDQWCLDRYRDGYGELPPDGAPVLAAREEDDPEDAVGRRVRRGGNYYFRGGLGHYRDGGLVEDEFTAATSGLRVCLSRRPAPAEPRVARLLGRSSAGALATLRELAEIPPGEPLDDETLGEFYDAVEHFSRRVDPRCVVPLLEVFRGPPDPGREPPSLLDPGSVEPPTGDEGPPVYELTPSRMWGETVYNGIVTALTNQPRAAVLDGIRQVVRSSDPGLRIRVLGLPFVDPALAPLYLERLRAPHRDERYAAAQSLAPVLTDGHRPALEAAYAAETSEPVRALLEDLLERGPAGD